MSSLLMASIIWVVFLLSNVIVGYCMYRIGSQGQIRGWSKKFNNEDEELLDKVNKTLGYIPGSEYSPFDNPPPRYPYGDDEDEDDFAPDPVTPQGGDIPYGERER